MWILLLSLAAGLFYRSSHSDPTSSVPLTSCGYCQHPTCHAKLRNQCFSYQHHLNRTPSGNRIGAPDLPILNGFSAAGTFLWTRYSDGGIRVGIIGEIRKGRFGHNLPGGKRDRLAESPVEIAKRELFEGLSFKTTALLPTDLEKRYQRRPRTSHLVSPLEVPSAAGSVDRSRGVGIVQLRIPERPATSSPGVD